MSSDFEMTSAWTFSRKNSGMIDEYIIDYEEYVGIGSGAFSYLDGGLFVNTFSPVDYEKKIENNSMLFSSIRHFDVHQQMRYRFMMDLFGLRLDKQRFKRDFGIPIELALLPEMTFMELSGAFAVNNSKEILLTPKGRYLMVVMMREFFSQVDFIRDQGRQSLSVDEKKVFLGADLSCRL
ncbi:MAG: coproporphyrinogen dehydrogenase, partial [Anaerolineae bacterium]|nr:coproporphyrinogen dehydrogenase [Anaerolineae bacterium]